MHLPNTALDALQRQVAPPPTVPCKPTTTPPPPSNSLDRKCPALRALPRMALAQTTISLLRSSHSSSPSRYNTWCKRLDCREGRERGGQGGWVGGWGKIGMRKECQA
jgi:hypothetical protein